MGNKMIVTISYDMDEKATRRYGQISPLEKCKECKSNPMNSGNGECNCRSKKKQFNYVTTMVEATA